jgi:transcriptional regulator with XRE-family HTH domain
MTGLSPDHRASSLPGLTFGDLGEKHVAEGLGLVLRTIRQQWQLTLREVAERSHRFAHKTGNPSYSVSAGWLNRIENGKHELTVNKLLLLADIYSVPTEQLLRFASDRDGLPEATTLLTAPAGPYTWGVIGKRDQTMHPMIPSGSIVLINTEDREISSRRDWTNEFQRPIYFLKTRDECLCGWCELDKNSEWLTLIPHPLSPASSRRWRYRTEIENVGRVISLGHSVGGMNFSTRCGHRQGA